MVLLQMEGHISKLSEKDCLSFEQKRSIITS